MIKEIVENRTLLSSLVIRDIKGRYIGSAMGILWNIITPILQLIVYTIVFSTIMKVKVGPQEGTTSFVAFLFCGLIPWNAFAETIQRSTMVIIENASLVKKIKFPTEILVIYLVISSFIHELIGLSVFIILLGWLGQLPHLPVLILPAIFALQLILTLGLSLLVSALNVYIRDIAHIMGLVMMVWFYATPIVYPFNMIPERFRFILYFNPMAILVTLYRNLFFLSGGVDLKLLIILFAYAVIFFAAGYTIFKMCKKEFVDLI